jgi:3-hydroxyisobutyrate dehydrogenase-like beta-hydroxyacid dehydrogenase
MGRPMAERLIAAGFDVVGHDVRPQSEFDWFGGHMTPDPQELRSCDTIISVVRDAQQTRDLLAAIGQPPPVFVISSTLSPRFIRQMRSELPESTAMIDAPMSGAPHSARDGSLSFMIGGEMQAIDRLMPAFEAMGGTLHILGALGAGATAKVLNNFVAASCVAAVRTVLDQAGPLGLDPARLRNVLDTSSGGTWFGTNLDRIDWAPETYDPANTIGILEKDVTAYLDAVTDGGAPDALTAAILDRLRNLPQLPNG